MLQAPFRYKQHTTTIAIFISQHELVLPGIPFAVSIGAKAIFLLNLHELRTALRTEVSPKIIGTVLALFALFHP